MFRFILPLLVALTVFLSFQVQAQTKIDFIQTSRELSAYQRQLLETEFTRVYPVQKSDFDSYARIESVEVTELLDLEVPEKTEKSLGQVIMIVDKLLGLGKKIWPIIEAGKPVLNTTFVPAISVLPKVENEPHDVAFYNMANWQAPRQRSYQVDFKNGWGIKVISFTYNVSYQYGGSYQGSGLYLTGVDVSASNISVSWGFNFNATSNLVSIANRGTEDDPIASATVKIQYEASSVLRNIQSAQSFHVTGAGDIEQVY
jgi:hypothetical protein